MHTPRALRALSLTLLLAQSAAVAQPSEGQSASVSPFFGAFTHSVPLSVPEYYDLEPALHLQYSSSAPNGLLGVGWDLAGVSSIERTGQSRGTPRYDASDIFLLDGQELVPCATGSTSPSCTSGGTHSTRIESYVRIRFDSAANTWTVTRKDGSRATYTALHPAYKQESTCTTSTTTTTTRASGTCGTTSCPTPPLCPAGYTDKGVSCSVTGSCSAGPTYSATRTCTLTATTCTTPTNVLLGTFQWGLTRVSDTRNHAVDFAWQCQGNPITACYPSSVTYNGARVELRYETRPDTVSTANGSHFARTLAQRLKTIDVQVGGTRLRAYKLSYAASGNSGRSLLTSVRQYGSDAVVDASGTVTGGTVLPAITASYAHAAAGFTQNVWSNSSDWRTYQAIPADYNGDGRTDLYLHGAASGRQDYLGLSTGAGFSQWTWNNATDWSGYRVIPGDFNGDGKADIFLQGMASGRQNYLGLSTGTSFSRWTWTNTSDWSGYDITTGDFNGDGKADLYLHARNAGLQDRMGLSNGAGFTVWTWSNGTDWSKYMLYTGDFNGDGKTDLYLHGKPGSELIDAMALSTGSAFELWTWTSPAPSHWNDYELVTGDFNGDGKTDIYLHGGKDSTLTDAMALSQGRTFELWTWTDSVSRSQYEAIAGDFNGDGMTDIFLHGRPPRTVSSAAACGGGCTAAPACPTGYSDQGSVCVTTGSCASGVPSWTATRTCAVLNDMLTVSSGRHFGRIPWNNGGADWSSHQLLPGDFNGDGRLDYYLHNDKSTGDSFGLSTGSGPTDLLVSLAPGTGGSTAVEYTPSSAWSNTSLPLGAVLQTASAVTVSDGRGASSTTRYQYQGGLWSSSERRFLGFRKVTSVLDAAGNYTETFFHQHVGCIGKPEVTYYRNPSGSLFKYSTYTYQESSTAPYTSLMTDRWEYECNLSTSCRRTLLQIGYDQYGNGNLTYEHGDYDVAGDERTSVRGLVPNTSAYLVGLPAYENLYAGIGTGGTLLKQTLFEYDGSNDYTLAPTKGLLTRQRSWNNQTGGYVARSFGYDAWGNNTSETDARGFTSTIEYDATYHRYPVRRCDALGRCTTQTWNLASGLLTSETDLNAGVTTRAYDVLGRLVQTSLPSGTTETLSYLDWGNPSLQRIRRSLSDGSADGLWSEEYEDGLGRNYRSVKEGGLTRDTLYQDGSSRVWKQSAWYATSETPQYQTFAFDGLGRLRTLTNADGTSAQRVYGNGYVTDYDELGHEKVTWTDAYGNISQVRERNGASYHHTTYQYDLLGNLTRVTNAAGHVTTVTWDSLGRKLSGCDPDTGCTTYTYDGAGVMLTQRNARGQTTRYTHDALGRPLTKTLADGNQVIWKYDEPGHGAGVGALTSTTDASGSESRDYDSAGRLTALTKCVTGLCYTTRYGFDVAGRLASVTYPDGEVVNHTYDAAGNLTSVGGYATGLTYNARGQLLQASYGNGTRATYSYNAPRQWLTHASVTGPTGTSLYQASYTYDAKARLTTQTSTTHSLSNVNYTYDELNRLTGVSGSQTQGFTYDALGNITANSQVGSYAYADTTHRHAVTTAGGSGYTYDATGNMLSGGGRTHAWDTENRLTQVTTSNGTTTFTYDGNGQRVKRAGPLGTDWFFGHHLEYGNNGLTKYYYAGSVLVARRDNTGVYWYHQDHLGSVRAISNASGTRVASYDYTAFGALAGTAPTFSNTRGYTGHVSDDTGLVYMNARYFDPVLGRFLSADSIVPALDNPQALNRYTYVYNNPISNIDPTGHLPVVAAIATAVSVGAATAWTGAAFVIATIGAATVTVGYILKDPFLMSLGSVLLGAATGWTFGAGYLGTAKTAGAAVVGGSMAALTSPVSPLSPKAKQLLGWFYAAQSMFHEYKNLGDKIREGARKMAKDVDFGEKFKGLKEFMLGDKTLETSHTAWQDLYGEAGQIVCGKVFNKAEMIALNNTGGLVGPGGGFFTQVLDTLTGWIPGVRAHGVLHDLSGYLYTTHGVGNGYVYAGNWFGLAKSLPLAGQVEGLLTTGGNSITVLLQYAR